MNRYDVVMDRNESSPIESLEKRRPAQAGETTRRGGVSAVTIVVIAAAVCIALLAFVNIAYAGETDVLQGVDTIARAG